jgi:DNA-binding transcriptional MerR regulator
MTADTLPAMITGPDGDMTEVLVAGDVSALAGITYRQCDYWVRTGLLRPECASNGSGSRRRWTADEIEVARTMGRLVRAGLPPETAHEVARSGDSRCEIGPGVWIEVRSA